jgi:hypothetical protein
LAELGIFDIGVHFGALGDGSRSTKSHHVGLLMRSRLTTSTSAIAVVVASTERIRAL